MHEIPELLNLPDGIARSFANRDYYGTASHNSKAQYQLYFGYFDGNPRGFISPNLYTISLYG